MAFIVHRPNMTNREREDYLRALRKHGIDLGQTSRVLDPDTEKIWLALISSREEAVSIAGRLNRETSSKWLVSESSPSDSFGPLGPVIFHLSRRSGYFIVHPHTQTMAMIQSAFPNATPLATGINVEGELWQRYKSTGRDLSDLVYDLAPTLTGLCSEQLQELGFHLVDVDSDEILVVQQPGVESVPG